MEANICDVNHLDADVLLPPRKRLLAGFKKQSSDGDAAAHPPPVASSSLSASPSSPSPHPASPAPCSPSSSEFQTRLNNLLSSHFNNSHNLSPGQIVEASRTAAVTAVRAAEAARAAAQEKAIIAAKAVTAAKNALALVASFPDEAANKERYLKRNKLKKHVQVQLLYKKHQPVENHGDDEEFARKLHRDMNSSPRISKNSSSSDGKGHKNKRLKSLVTSERSKISDGSVVFPGNRGMCNGQTVAGELDYEDSMQEVYTSAEDICKYGKAVHGDMENGEAEWKDRIAGDEGSASKKRGRVKLKRLALSNCSNRDKSKAKEDNLWISSALKMGNPVLSGMEKGLEKVKGVEGGAVRKCQGAAGQVMMSESCVVSVDCNRSR